MRVYLCKDITGRHFLSIEEPEEDSGVEIVYILEDIPGEIFAILDRMIEVIAKSKLPKTW